MPRLFELESKEREKEREKWNVRVWRGVAQRVLAVEHLAHDPARQRVGSDARPEDDVVRRILHVAAKVRDV